MIKKILFVCMGNICRSPTAEAVFQNMINKKKLQSYFQLDSAGTHSYHLGSSPDGRSQQAAMRRNIAMNHLRARQVVQDDLKSFDYIVAMDQKNIADLESMFNIKNNNKIVLMMSFAENSPYSEVPDPYYGSSDGFELVLDLLEQAAEGLLDFLQVEQARD